jgi:hypothetical protein
MVWEPTVGEEPELREMVFALVRPSPSQDSERVKPVGTVTVGSAQSDVLISVTDRVAVMVVLSCKLLFEMLALKARVGVAGNTVMVWVMAV